MIKNYLKVAWRNIIKNKTFSFINIFGLSIGLTCCMLITLYLHYEKNYDSYQANISNLYQVGTTFIHKGQKDDKAARTSPPIGAAMKQEFPEIEESARLVNIFYTEETLFQYSTGSATSKSIYETKGYLADPAFFKLFTYNFIEGNPLTALNDPASVVLSEKTAQKIFGNQSALNKVIHISNNANGDLDCIVTGVFRPNDQPSHIDPNFFMSSEGGSMGKYIRDHANDFGGNNMFYTYLLLKPGTNPKNLEAKFPAFIQKYAEKDLKAMGRDKRQFLIPVKDIHLNTEITSNITPTGSKMYLNILASIAIFTLLIACINFMNLSTARSSKRSAEVGVRKVLGAERTSLIRQFLGESLIMALIAFGIAVAFTKLLLPYFNQVADKNIYFNLSQSGRMLIVFFGLALVTGIIAGSYPAFYLSSFRPIKVLKGKFSNSLAAVSIRKSLVVFQFIISVVLIIASVVIARQMNYMQSADLGFAKDQQLVIPLRSKAAKSLYTTLKNEIRKNGKVSSVGASMYYPGIFNPTDSYFYRDGQTMDDAKDVKLNMVDYDFLQTMDIKRVAGRLFAQEFVSDTGRAIIINEATVRELGFASAEQAAMQKLHFDFGGKHYQFDIVGVVKDFNFEDLHSPIRPFGFGIALNGFNYLIVHSKGANIGSLLSSIQQKWHALNPDEPFEYSFLDEDFQKNYKADNRLAAIVSSFTVIAILISCLGLFGLATFSAEQRKKEIGVRKVLGANMGNIVSLLSKDFLKLVFIGVLIASPIAWWIMDKWLRDFAYRTDIGWQVFAITTALALCITLFTISFQSIKAAILNPVKSLRTE
jgi:putative ABC transport system permease protein